MLKAKKEKDRVRFSDRNKELTRNWREEQRKNAEKDRIIAELQEKTKLKAPPEQGDYEDFTKFKADADRWEKQKEAEIEQRIISRHEQEKENQRQRVRAEEVAAKWSEQQKYGKKTYDNFNTSEREVKAAVDDFGAWSMRDTILESEHGASIINYLGEHTAELDDIAQLPPSAQTRAILRIEAKVQAKAPKTISSAAEPIRQGKASAKAPVNPANETQYEYNRRMNGFK